ncbi:amidohydrolase 2 [Periconia macrospinosa]|uniref:Amidohydrolase 2 n=1 Tax=Periconia macrospinosa TaxID=97972 RepID=A0A2V1D205_9PLEO|nr:amidohydrolase 2 [Periconia macrospinosa]
MYVAHSSTPSKPCYLPKRLVALEEHVVAPSLEAEVITSGLTQSYPDILEKLKDVGAGRLAAMDVGHVSMSVLAQQSQSGSEDPEGCRAANDALQSAIKANPKRFAGFAVLHMALPEEAATELNRTVTELGFKGAMIWNHLKDGTYYDAARFDPVFAMAQKLDVPIYLHPAPPATAIGSKLFAGNYSLDVARQLGTTSWGWHVDVGTHVLRLYAAGLFDRFPKLKLIIGHNGEGLPMFIDRIDATKLRNDTTFNRVWNTNIWITTSGFFTTRHFEQLRQVSPIERIMYSVDYPFASTTEGWEFVGNLSQAQILSENEIDLFAYKNAEALLRL